MNMLLAFQSEMKTLHNVWQNSQSAKDNLLCCKNDYANVFNDQNKHDAAHHLDPGPRLF